MNNNYLFTSSRLGFREWNDDDVDPMTLTNNDPDVMKYFPSTQIGAQTEAFIRRMQNQFEERGYCYFAVDTLQDNKFIGFIGLSFQTFKASFTPCIDIGWRLANDAWGNGYATEGALRCLQYGFDLPGVEEIYSMAPKVNEPSINVMQKIGMHYVSDFKHPLLVKHPQLEDCILYKIQKPR
ncbi:MAG: GNAT family N-acetyltransferase [Bacteroidetes bacterium]|nr:GNAT family N-acetyltransferase [Bacteroidota bacterium]